MHAHPSSLGQCGQELLSIMTALITVGGDDQQSRHG